MNMTNIDYSFQPKGVSSQSNGMAEGHQQRQQQQQEQQLIQLGNAYIDPLCTGLSSGQSSQPEIISWNIRDSDSPKVSTHYDRHQDWPDNNCWYVYRTNDELARRHCSGWAMRNTNNHNMKILKKSCLGVMVCSKRCVIVSNNTETQVHVRPHICDKARSKQIGKACPNRRCDGKLELLPCRGNSSNPVTHFWRETKEAILFESKGTHDHIRPEPKSSAQTRRALLIVSGLRPPTKSASSSKRPTVSKAMAAGQESSTKIGGLRRQKRGKIVPSTSNQQQQQQLATSLQCDSTTTNLQLSNEASASLISSAMARAKGLKRANPNGIGAANSVKTTTSLSSTNNKFINGEQSHGKDTFPKVVPNPSGANGADGRLPYLVYNDGYQRLPEPSVEVEQQQHPCPDCYGNNNYCAATDYIKPAGQANSSYATNTTTTTTTAHENNNFYVEHRNYGFHHESYNIWSQSSHEADLGRSVGRYDQQNHYSDNPEQINSNYRPAEPQYQHHAVTNGENNNGQLQDKTASVSTINMNLMADHQQQRAEVLETSLLSKTSSSTVKAKAGDRDAVNFYTYLNSRHESASSAAEQQQLASNYNQTDLVVNHQLQRGTEFPLAMRENDHLNANFTLSSSSSSSSLSSSANPINTIDSSRHLFAGNNNDSQQTDCNNNNNNDNFQSQAEANFISYSITNDCNNSGSCESQVGGFSNYDKQQHQQQQWTDQSDNCKFNAASTTFKSQNHSSSSSSSSSASSPSFKQPAAIGPTTTTAGAFTPSTSYPYHRAADNWPASENQPPFQTAFGQSARNGANPATGPAYVANSAESHYGHVGNEAYDSSAPYSMPGAQSGDYALQHQQQIGLNYENQQQPRSAEYQQQQQHHLYRSSEQEYLNVNQLQHPVAPPPTSNTQFPTTY